MYACTEKKQAIKLRETQKGVKNIGEPGGREGKKHDPGQGMGELVVVFWAAQCLKGPGYEVNVREVRSHDEACGIGQEVRIRSNQIAQDDSGDRV